MPLALHGVAERPEQIAAMHCDPPLPIVCWALPTDADPEMGYLVADVPASPLAPHMVPTQAGSAMFADRRTTQPPRTYRDGREYLAPATRQRCAR